MGLVEKLARSQRGASDGMGECLGLGLGRWWGFECGLGFGWRASMRQKLDFVCYRAGKVREGFADVGRVVVGFVGVLGSVLLCMSGEGSTVSGTAYY